MKYEEQLFKFLTEESNFTSAFSITKSFPSVLKKVKEDFWEDVADKIKKKAPEWSISSPPKKEGSKYGWIEMRLNNDGRIRFGCEFSWDDGIYIGLAWNDEIINKNEIRERIKDKVSKSKLGGWKKSDWFPAYRAFGGNLGDIETLKGLLPANRGEFSEELANELVELATSNEGLLRVLLEEVETHFNGERQATA